MPAAGDFAFAVRVGGGHIQLEEYHDAKSGADYIAMPINSPELTYQAEFTEELPHGEVVTQMWPVAPYQVRAHNNSDSTVFVYMYVDGLKVALYAAEPHAYCTFSDVAVASNPKERKELLFSLPRRVTQAEKKCAGGKALTPEQTAALGTIRLEFYRAKFVFERWAQEYPTFGDYTQGNKTDAAASKAKGAASTRLGKTTQTTQGYMRKYYDCDEDTCAELTLRYRTRHFLIEHGIIPDPAAAAARKAEKERKRAAKRKRNREEQSARKGGASAVEIVLQDDDSAPVVTVKRERTQQAAVVIDP